MSSDDEVEGTESFKSEKLVIEGVQKEKRRQTIIHYEAGPQIVEGVQKEKRKQTIIDNEDCSQIVEGVQNEKGKQTIIDNEDGPLIVEVAQKEKRKQKITDNEDGAEIVEGNRNVPRERPREEKQKNVARKATKDDKKHRKIPKPPIEGIGIMSRFFCRNHAIFQACHFPKKVKKRRPKERASSGAVEVGVNWADFRLVGSSSEEQVATGKWMLVHFSSMSSLSSHQEMDKMNKACQHVRVVPVVAPLDLEIESGKICEYIQGFDLLVGLIGPPGSIYELADKFGVSGRASARMYVVAPSREVTGSVGFEDGAEEVAIQILKIILESGK